MIFLSFTDKYRPKTLDEVIGQPRVVKVLRAIIQKQEAENFLFTGLPGVGKTTVAFALAKEIGYEFIYRNASDDRGIDFVRNEIKNAVRTKANVPSGKKLIFLDEADNMTEDAQKALKSMMELHANRIMFILAVNEPWKVISAIRSRCVPLKFKALEHDDMLKILNTIADNEHIQFSEEAKDKLIKISNGSMRDLINNIIAYQTEFDGPDATNLDDFWSAIKLKDFKKAYQQSYDYNMEELILAIMDDLSKTGQLEHCLKLGEYAINNPQPNPVLGKRTVIYYLIVKGVQP